MAKTLGVKPSGTEEVNLFMAQLQHPLKAEIEAVRAIILGTDKKLSERVKWNAPSFYYKQDLITIHVKATKQVHLIFHNIAIASVTSPLLEGDYKDRRMMYLRTMDEVKQHTKELQRIMKELIAIMDK